VPLEKADASFEPSAELATEFHCDADMTGALVKYQFVPFWAKSRSPTQKTKFKINNFLIKLLPMKFIYRLILSILIGHVSPDPQQRCPVRVIRVVRGSMPAVSTTTAVKAATVKSIGMMSASRRCRRNPFRCRRESSRAGTTSTATQARVIPMASMICGRIRPFPNRVEKFLASQ
jgi:hypothetical protein